MRKKILATLATCLFLIGITGIVNAIPLNDLFNGGTYQFNNLILSDWQLVNATNVNIDNIDIGDGYNSNEFGVLTENHELYLGQTEYYNLSKQKTLSFDFLVTGIGVDLTGIRGDLGYRRMSGYSNHTPRVTGKIEIGTSQGSNDLGQLTDIWSFTQNTNPDTINFSNGLSQIWMRTTIDLTLPYRGYIEVGYYNNDYGPAFCNGFTTQPTATAPVPEPATMLLFGTGLAGLVGTKLKRKKK